MRVPYLFVIATLLATPAAAQNAPVAVAKPLAEVAMHPEREAAAQVVSLNESRIAAEIAGRIEAVPVEVGQRLDKGAVIARIDCRDHELTRDHARAALAAVRSRLALAEQQLARAKELSAQGFFADEALAARTTEAAVLSADLAQAEVQLAAGERAVGKCVVRSPFPAIVRERLGRVGELATPGTPLAALVDAGRIEVAAQVQAKDTGSLERATEVRFLGPRGALPLALERVSPAIDPQTRSVDARLRFTGQAAAPGASGRIAWRDSDAYVAPELVVRRAGRLGIFVDDAGTARFHALAGAQEGRPARVDLPGSARIVVKGQLALRDGQLLR